MSHRSLAHQICETRPPRSAAIVSTATSNREQSGASREDQERRLLHDLLDGKSEAETQFVEQYSRACAGLARKSGVPHPDSQDVAQDSLFAALLQIRRRRFRQEATLQEWLFSIVRRRAARYWRDRQRSPRGNLLEGHPDDLCQKRIPPSSLESQVVMREALYYLRSKKHIEVLLLSALGGHTIAEIAEILTRHNGPEGMSPGRVGSVLAEAKHRMKRVLASDFILQASARSTRVEPSRTDERSDRDDIISHLCQKHTLTWTWSNGPVLPTNESASGDPNGLRHDSPSGELGIRSLKIRIVVPSRAGQRLTRPTTCQLVH